MERLFHRSLVCAALLRTSTACTFVVDDYSVGTATASSCPAFEAPDQDGRCEGVGVLPDACGDGFASDDRGGCVAILPPDECGPDDHGPTSAWPGKSVCAGTLCSGQWPQEDNSLVPMVFVATTGTTDGDGSRERPYATITAAIASGARQVLVGNGTFTENVQIDAPLLLRGVCPAQTTIVAEDPNLPVLSFGSQSEGSLVRGLELRGGTEGVAINGATGMSLNELWIHDVSHAGMSIEDAPDGTINRIFVVLIEHAADAGIELRGSQVEIGSTMIRDIGASAVAEEGIGIAIHPARHAPPPPPPTLWMPSLSPVSTVALNRSFIERAGKGILVEGSNLVATGVAIRDTARGVVAAWRPLGSIPTTLTLRQSTIERSTRVGVDVWNASATVEDTTISSSGTSCVDGDADLSPGAFLGNGIRARFDRPDVPVADRTVTVRRSVVDRAAQSAVHVEGGSLVLEHSIVRDTSAEACSGRFGDGVTAYSYDFSEAEVHLTTNLVQSSARAGVVTFGAPVTLTGGLFECNTSDLLRAAESTRFSGPASCGCDGEPRDCVPTEVGDLDRSVVAADCDSGLAADCFTGCFEDFFAPGTLVSGATISVMDAPHVAPQVTDDLGCATLGGLKAGARVRPTLVHPDYMPAIAYTEVNDGPISPPRTLTAAISIGAHSVTPQFSPSGDSPIDMATCPAVGIFICARPPAEEQSGPATFASNCSSGITGMTVDLVPQVPTTAAGPIYSNIGLLPDTSLSAAEGGFFFYLNVPAGDYDLVLHPPPGSGALDCAGDLLGGGTSSAWPIDASRFHFRAEEGYLAGAAFVYCDLVQR